MAKIQDIDIPHLEFAEAAAPATPASGIVRIYAKTDGLLYSKDDAGAETLVSGGAGSGGGYSEGTAFPGGPSTDDKFYRTDRNILYFYDGTRWLSTNLYRETMGIGNTVTPAGIAVSNLSRWTPWSSEFDLYLEALYTSTYPATTNSGSHYHGVTLNKVDASDTPTSVCSFDTSADTVNNWTQRKTSIGAVYTASGHRNFALAHSVTGTPGDLYWSAAISYRLIG